MKSFGEIKTRVDLASFLDISVKDLTHILYVKKPDSYYHTFVIPKKSGGDRIISAPAGILKKLQSKLAKAIVKYQTDLINRRKQQQTNISHGFEKGKSIITNARIHRNKRYVVNIDLENYFDTFHIGRVIGYFEKNRYFSFPHDVSASIGQLVCYQGKLPQGAPSSPVITNLICQILDFRLLRVAKKFKMDYTRYADDLTFSTNNKGFLYYQNDFLLTIASVINRAGFTVNEKKTRIQYRDSRQEVTGIVVNRKLSVNRDYVRKTRAMAHELYKTGKFMIDGVPGDLAQLEGRFAFINQLDAYNRAPNKVPNKAPDKTLNKASNKAPDKAPDKTLNKASNKAPDKAQQNIGISEKKDKSKFNARENQYRQFLFYKYFFANDKPLIVTEGITDILYLKAALRNLCDQYPQLIEKGKDGKFRYKIRFLSKTQRLKDLLYIGQDGADTMGNIYRYFIEENNKNTRTPNYFKYFTKICNCEQKYPVMLLYDNENSNDKNVKKKRRPLATFFSKVLKAQQNEKDKLKAELEQDFKVRLVPESKLFLITNPLVGEKLECEIEDLFPKEVLATKLNGKTFNRDPNADNSKHYGKRKFAEHIYAHYKEIDFEGFTRLLKTIESIIVEEGGT